MSFDEQGRQVLKGQEALDAFAGGVGRLIQEGRKLQGKTEFQGIPISIENRKGSVRSGKGPEGDWKTKMKHPYGYIKGTRGLDGDQLDCFVGPDENVGFAYVVHTKKPPDFKKNDEDKVMLGFSSAKTAKKAFLQHYDDPKFFGSMDTIPMAQFLDKAEEADSRKLVASVRAVTPLALITRDTPDALGSLMSHYNIERDIDVRAQNTMPPELKKRRKIKEFGRRRNTKAQEAQEFGVKGQKWGQRKPEEKKGERPSGKQPWSAATQKKAQSLAADPRTMNMMQVARSAQLTMNNKARQQRVDSPPKLLHQEALGALKNQGWKIGGTMATKSKDGKSVLYSTGVANPSGGKINIYTLHTGTGFVHYAGKKANQPLYGQGVVKVRKTKKMGGQASKPVRSSVREALRLREAKKKVIYYARPLSRYGTAQEAGEIQALKEMFPQFRIKAPKRSFHSTKGLEYYHDMAESADMIVVSPRRKNRLSAGVWSEARHATKKKIPVFMLKEGSLSRIGKVKIYKKPDPIGDFGVAIRKYRRRSA